MQRLHQIVAGFRPFDAISEEAVLLRDLFRSWGRTSDIFTEPLRTAPEARSQIRDIAECAAECGPQDAALLHLSIGSDVNDAFAALRCRKIILYHNITPPHFFRSIHAPTARLLERGLAQMRQLAGSAAVNLADSAFNAAEMAGCGYADVRVFPLMLGAARLGTQPDPATLREFGDGALNALCVGRCAPNKRVEHAIQACALLQASVARPVRFLHAGSWAGMENYRALLGALARDLGLVRAEFLGPVSQARLAALYRAATVFVCPSEHEGFCAPILEAMAAGVPVVARAAGAVPETLDGAGILVREPSPDLVAEILARLAADDALRRAVLEGQRDRMARYRARDLPGELRQHLAPLLAPAP